MLGTREIILVHHTDCGMLTFTDDGFKQQIADETGLKPQWAAEAFTDLDEDVRQSLRRIEASPFVTLHESLHALAPPTVRPSTIRLMVDGDLHSHIGHPAARSFVVTRSTMTFGRSSISALTLITVQPIASRIAIRSMSHDRWRRSAQCWTPSYSTATRHCGQPMSTLILGAP